MVSITKRSEPDLSRDTSVALFFETGTTLPMSLAANRDDEMDTLAKRITAARGDRWSQAEFARELGVTRSSVSQWESGTTEPSAERLRKIAVLSHVNYNWLATGRGDQFAVIDQDQSSDGTDSKITQLPVQERDSNARLGGTLSLSYKIPAYGQAMGGRHGEFVLNGNKVADILAPPALEGVQDAYAVFIAGDSMEPRYFAGEVAYIHPGMPVRRGDFVVAQIADGDDGSAPLAFVKRFLSMDDKKLKLEQLNPKKVLEFPRRRVVSVHLVLMAGRG